MALFISELLSVFGLVVALLAAVLRLRRREPIRTVRRILLLVAVGYLLLSVHAVSAGIGRLLVTGYRPFSATDVESGRTVIVLLGAGERAISDWDGHRLTVIGRVGASRAFEAARVYRLLPDAWIISSGGSRPPSPSSAAAMQELLVRLAIPASRILLEERSASTREEAVLIAPMLAQLRAEHVVLVTSDVHMRRALGVFRAVGVPAVPAIARDPSVPLHWLDRYLPSNIGLATGDSVVHELIGLGYYAARGWWR